ncbi:proteasome assembly chaperone family protein [Salininema proteolyticum]|uniref:Proteasome assembly chaperone family protein n=1 Tax=Salininema proteolyticum TaxID=1607685 RepID=A0ABV8U0H1_9ACTN
MTSLNHDPWTLCDILSEPSEVRGAPLLYFFEGFMDAGSAGQGVVDFLLDAYDHEPVASFNVDALIDYRSRRPPLTFEIDRWSDYEAPSLVVYLLHDSADNPFLLLHGPEPDFAWERFTDSLESLIDHWNIPVAVGFQGIPMGVPHTRPVGLTVHATRPELVFDNRPMFNEVTVPGHMAGLLEYRLGQSGRDVVGLSAHVPHYVMQMSFPAATMRLLAGVEHATGLSLPKDEALEEDQKRVIEEIAAQAEESEEVATVVESLEEQYDSYEEAAENDDMLREGRMPTADELGEAFERFLAEQDNKKNDDKKNNDE